MKNTLNIYPLTLFHEQQWRPLWQGYLEFYNADLSADVTAHTWQTLCNSETVGGFGAFEGDHLIGFVHYVNHPCTWAKEGYCYLEDLFVSPAARGTGAGRALITAVYDMAQSKNISRVYWMTQAGNDTARKLYDQIAQKSDFVQYRKDF